MYAGTGKICDEHMMKDGLYGLFTKDGVQILSPIFRGRVADYADMGKEKHEDEDKESCVLVDRREDGNMDLLNGDLPLICMKRTGRSIVVKRTGDGMGWDEYITICTGAHCG